jgi:hypothetical protein
MDSDRYADTIGDQVAEPLAERNEDGDAAANSDEDAVTRPDRHADGDSRPLGHTSSAADGDRIGDFWAA